ncbi:tetratricopeptide repeat protein [candidate division KSB1 bacterium]|nr:tetratricopeptide repeat protein [candidate division KSB1 bacterium]
MKSRNILSLLFITGVIISCSQVERTKKTTRDVSATDYYRAGKQALNNDDWEKAAILFNRAIKANPRYANAYAGAALVLAMKDQPEKAIEYAEKAVKLDANAFDAQLNRGRVLKMSKPTDWFERAIASFDAALKLNPADEEALFYKAEALNEHGDLAAARNLYAKVAEKEGLYAQSANAHISYITAYLSTDPRSDVGKEILKVEAISRAELAALLVAEFDAGHHMRRRNPNYAGGSNLSLKTEEQTRIQTVNRITDINGLAAESWIKEVVQVGAMDVYPDNSFRPFELVQRMNLAMTLQNIIIQATGNTSLYTAFLNSAPPFSDVKRTHYAFNAICLVTEYEIMPKTTNSTLFDLDGTVSGYDALSALRNLEQFLVQSF